MPDLLPVRERPSRHHDDYIITHTIDPLRFAYAAGGGVESAIAGALTAAGMDLDGWMDRFDSPRLDTISYRGRASYRHITAIAHREQKRADAAEARVAALEAELRKAAQWSEAGTSAPALGGRHAL